MGSGAKRAERSLGGFGMAGRENKSNPRTGLKTGHYRGKRNAGTMYRAHTGGKAG